MEALKMTQFCAKYNLPQYIICKRIKEYDHIYIEGKVKPRVFDNEKNAKLAKKHSHNPAHRPRKPVLEFSEYLKKYNIDEATIKIRWKCIQKVEVDGIIFIADVRNNLRHCGLL
jgi:hypothetical protein